MKPFTVIYHLTGEHGVALGADSAGNLIVVWCDHTVTLTPAPDLRVPYIGMDWPQTEEWRARWNATSATSEHARYAP